MHAHTMAWICETPTSSFTMSPRRLQHASWQSSGHKFAHTCVSSRTACVKWLNHATCPQEYNTNETAFSWIPPAAALHTTSQGHALPSRRSPKLSPERSGGQHALTNMPRSCHTRCRCTTRSTSSPRDLQGPYGAELPKWPARSARCAPSNSAALRHIRCRTPHGPQGSSSPLKAPARQSRCPTGWARCAPAAAAARRPAAARAPLASTSAQTTAAGCARAQQLHQCSLAPQCIRA